MKYKYQEKFMRIIVFFDLPVSTKKERYYATRFRHDLLNDGYYMMQFSVYSRMVKGLADAEKHIQRLHSLTPPSGSVRVLTVTEKQFADMFFLVGQSPQAEKIGTQQLLMF